MFLVFCFSFFHSNALNSAASFFFLFYPIIFSPTCWSITFMWLLMFCFFHQKAMRIFQNVHFIFNWRVIPTLRWFLLYINMDPCRSTYVPSLLPPSRLRPYPSPLHCCRTPSTRIFCGSRYFIMLKAQLWYITIYLANSLIVDN